MARYLFRSPPKPWGRMDNPSYWLMLESIRGEVQDAVLLKQALNEIDPFVVARPSWMGDIQRGLLFRGGEHA